MAEKITIELKRGSKGLGFNIIGGMDMPRKLGDYGIYVSKIKAGGAADVDGTLQVGDKIIMVNSVSLENVEHKEAVSTFLSSGDDVILVIEKPILSHDTCQTSNAMKIVLPVIALVIGISLGIYFFTKKSKN